MPSWFGGIIGLLVVGTLSFLLRSATREAAAQGDLRVLEYSVAWKWLVRVLWIFPVAIAVWAIVSPPSAEEWWIPFAIVGGFSAILAPLHLEVMKRRIELTPEALTVKSAWRAPVRIAWPEVSAVAWKALASELELRSAAGTRARVSAWLSGTATLADEVERRAARVPGLEGALSAFRAFGQNRL